MNDNLITEIIDLNKVKANLMELQKMWEQLIVSMAAKSGKDLKFDNLAQNLKTVTIAETELSKAKQAGIEIDGKKAKITAEIIANYDKYSKEEQKIIENEIKRKAQIAETNRLLKDRFTNEQNLIKVLQRETKSIADLDKQNKDLQRIQQKLNLTTKEGQEANAKINAQIEKNKQTTKEYTNVLDAQKRNIGNYPESMNKAGMSVSKFSAGMVAAYAAISMAAKQVYAAVKESIDLFLEQEKQSFRVRKAFKDYAGTINEAADANQLLTGVGNEQYQKLAVLANSYGIANNQVNDSVRNSIGLATKFEAAGLGQEQALKMLAQAQNGNYRALVRYIPELKKAANEQEALNIINNLAAEGFETAQKYANTYGGKITQVKNATGDLKETIGKGVMTGILDVDDGNKAVETINKLNETIERTGIISKYLRMMREQALMMFEPFLNLFKIFGEGGSAIDGLVVAVNVWFKVMQAIQVPVKLLWSFLTSLTGVILDVANAFRGKGELKSFQDGLNIINKAIVTLLSPISDLVGMSDEVSKFFGVQREQINLTAEEYEKLNALLFDYKSIIEDVKKTIKENEETQKMTEDLEEQENAIEEANKRYADYIANIVKANEEAKLSIELGENRVEVRKKEIEAIYSATKAYFELNGYTAAEIAKLKELRAEIDKLSAEIANTPKLLEKQDVDAVKSTAKITGEISTNMRNVAPAVNDTAAGLDKLELTVAKLRNAFNDFFGTEPIEDWRDTFKESITTVVNESFELYNQIIDLQNEKFDQELDNIDRLYDKQMSGLESVYDRRKKLLEATIDDEERLAAELARIEQEKADVQAKFQDEKLKKEQEIAQKQAILAKKKAAMEVAAGSASALVEAIKLIGIATTAAAPGDPYSLVARIAAALAAALTVVGAVTSGIAKVKAIEIPQFWAGGEAQEGQLISVAERGKELAVGESGKSYMFDKQSVLVAPEKMRIFSNKETRQITEKQTINNTYEKQSNVNLTVNIDNERHKKYFKLN
jgi:hypothetical protein